MPALDYTLWIDEANSSRMTRQLYARDTVFPLGFLCINRLQASKQRAIDSLYPGFYTEVERAQQVI